MEEERTLQSKDNKVYAQSKKESANLYADIQNYVFYL